FAGREASVRMIKASDVKKFYESYYVPQSTVISIVGNVPGARVQKACENYLIDYDRQAVKHQSVPTGDTLRESGRVVRMLPIQTEFIVAGFPAPALSNPDYAAFTVLTALTGGGNSSRLFKAMRETAGVGYVVGAQTPVLAMGSHLLAFVEFDPKRAQGDGK